MKIPFALAVSVTLVLSPLTASAADGKFCKNVKAPLISKPDLNADGKVTGQDLRMAIHSAGKKGVYSPVYDTNGDGVTDITDVANVRANIGETSTKRDIKIATSLKPCSTAAAK